MKAVLLAAMLLSGLCADAMASPLNWLIDDNPTVLPALDDSFTAPVIERDLDFYYGSIRDAFLTGDPSETADANALAIDVNEASDSLRLPAQLSFPIVAALLGCMGILFFLRRELRKQKRRARHRRPGIRPITAAR